MRVCVFVRGRRGNLTTSPRPARVGLHAALQFHFEQQRGGDGLSTLPVAVRYTYITSGGHIGPCILLITSPPSARSNIANRYSMYMDVYRENIQSRAALHVVAIIHTLKDAAVLYEPRCNRAGRGARLITFGRWETHCPVKIINNNND